MTRIPITALFIIAAALLGETQASSAQSAYSYPWCGSRYVNDGTSESCYYSSREQCMATMSGAGGLCFESPYYRARATEPVHRPLTKRRPRRHAE
jgi:hypothetical protein